MDIKTLITNPLFGTIVLGGLSWLFAMLFKQKSDARKQLAASLVHHATLAIHDWDTLDPSATADRLSAIFTQVDQVLAANGWQPLSSGEKAIGGLQAQALVGAVAAKAASVTVPATALASPSKP